MRKQLTTILIFIISFNLFGQTKQPNDSIEQYVEFLSQKSFYTPKEYIFDLYKENDIIILSEREHPEITQYELITNILKDERFKGNIFTEIGTFNSSKKINEFLTKEGLTEKQKKDEILKIERDLTYRIAWDPYNYYYLLSSIYDINQTRKIENKILLYPLDISFDWNSIKNHEQYKMFNDLQYNHTIDRDVVMGVNFISAYQKAIKNNKKRNKALVILNTYHGYTKIPTYKPLPSEPFIYSTAEYIYKTYPKTTKNILINSRIFYPKESLVADGKWDAAFKYTGNKNIGFNLKDTPFGTTQFDMYNFGEEFEKINFENIFDGFVFFYPIQKFKLAFGIPDIYTTEYIDQFYSRIALIKGISEKEARESKEINDLLKRLNSLRYIKKENLNKLNGQINKWLDK